MGANLRFALLALWTGILCLASLAQNTTNAFDRELKKYVHCNVTASRSIARQEGDLISLALAARGMCIREHAALSTALRRVYQPALVLRLLDRARSRQLESNAAAIAVVRQSKSSSSPKLPTGQSVSFGTGFYVSQEGHIITNDHVVRGCRSALIGQPAQASRVALIVARDPINDLALLSTSKAPAAVPAFKLTVQTGEEIAVYGFPFGGLLSTSGNFTMGNVTAAVGWETTPATCKSRRLSNPATVAARL